jgi:PAS domain S-box-containing protein
VGIFLCTVPGGELLRVNEYGARMFGYASPEEFLALGKDVEHRVFVPREHRQELLHKVLDCRDFVRAETDYRRKDGSVFIGRLHARAVWNDRGEPVFIEGFLEDITEKRRAETALQQSEARYRTQIERAPLPISMSRNGKTLYVNPKYMELFGCGSAESEVGRPVTERWAPEWWDVIEERARDRSQGFPVPTNYEGEALRDDGSRFPIQVAATLVELPDGPATVAFLTDITQLKEVEAELKRYQDHLEELVAARTADLREANRELEAFSYSVSHDLRAPLRAIHGFAQIILQRFAPSLPQEGQTMLSQISNQIERMRQLIDDLLAFSRAGRQELQQVPIDMEAAAREAFAEQTASNPKTVARIQIDPLPPALGDRSMISVVFNNLLSNALKYSRNRNPAVIEVSGYSQGTQNVYCIKDNGAGFDMRDAAKLFDVFQRLHSSAEFEGIGLGLALVQRIIQRHGGRVWAEGKIDAGATFSFSLPAQNTNT